MKKAQKGTKRNGCELKLLLSISFGPKSDKESVIKRIIIAVIAGLIVAYVSKSI